MDDYIAKNPNLLRARIIKIDSHGVRVFCRYAGGTLFGCFVYSGYYELLQYLAAALIIPSEGASPLTYLRKYVSADKFYCDDWKITWRDGIKDQSICIPSAYVERLGEYMLLRETACGKQDAVWGALPQPIAEEIAPEVAF